MKDALGRCSRCSCSAAPPTSRSRPCRKLVAGRARTRRARRHASPKRCDAASPRAARRRRVRGRPVAFDATDFASHEAFVDDTFDRFGDFDLVLVAFGVLGDQERAEHDAAAALEIVQTNYTGAVSVTVPLVERLRAPGPRHARAAVVGRRRARAPLELRVRLVEGRHRRLLPRPRRPPGRAAACT